MEEYATSMRGAELRKGNSILGRHGCGSDGSLQFCLLRRPWLVPGGQAKSRSSIDASAIYV